MVYALGNTPSIIMWVIFDEGQRQYDTPRLVSVVRKLDPSRLVNEAGGGYTNITKGTDLEELCAEFSGQLKTFRDQRGISAGVYARTTDVKNELNSLLTYGGLTKRDIVPASEKVSRTWKYTTLPAAADWFRASFDDAPGLGIIGMPWTNTPGDIWLRLVIRDYHDVDMDVHTKWCPGLFITRVHLKLRKPSA